MLVQAVRALCTFKFGLVTLENTLLVVQKRLLWIIYFFWLLSVYSILQTSWLTSQFIVGWDCSPSQEETLQALLESVLE